MYKTTFAHRRATKSDSNDRLSTKLHFFFASYKLFQYDRSSFDFFCNFVGREGGVSDMRFHHSVATCLHHKTNRFFRVMNLLSGEEVKRKEVKILNHIVAVCEKHGLRYYLSYGTLLGAIRHKGFIPWDDDIDISMPRADYEQLLKVMLANPDKRFVALTPKSKGYPYHYAKVVDLSTKLVEENLDDFAGNGLWVDIFPLDGVDTTEPTRQKKLAKYFNSCRASASFKHCPANNKPWKWRICKMIGTRNFSRLVTWASRRLPFDSAQYVAHMPTAMQYLFPRRLFDKVIKVEFEGALYDAPADYDEYLKILYADYMQIPPESQRITHSVKAIAVDL